MFRQCLIALFLFSSGGPLLGARAVPFMDLPSELVMDVNKPPYPIVNVIADRADARAVSSKSLHSNFLMSKSRNEQQQEHSFVETNEHFSKFADLELKKLATSLKALSEQSLAVHRLRSEPNKKLGEKIGSLIRDGDQHMASDVRRGDGEPRAFQASVTDKVDAHHQVLVNPAVSQVIEQANELAENKHVDSEGDACVRNWAHTCPDGWSVSGSTCVAPESYGGACQRLQSFVKSTVLEKSKFAADCKAPWPCQDQCSEGRSYSETCPASWSDVGGGFCAAPEDGHGKCASLYNFADMTIDEKQALAITCGFEWPCQVSCTQDFDRPCPEGWAEPTPNLCIAPSSYPGDCEYSINTAGMSTSQKQAFADKCSVAFPCA